jgi:hypothetical protein
VAKRRGNCYVTEALYHLLGGKKAGYVPYRVRHEGDVHWYLMLDRTYIIDPTVKQFKTPPPYEKGRGSGFLTKRPSKRAREMMKRMVWQ